MWLLSYENFIDPILGNVRRIMPVFIGMKAGDKVLDVCCGTGAQVIAFGHQGILAVGIDKDQRMIRTALKNNKKLNTINTSFYLADAIALPFKDKTFDFVSICFGLHDKERDSRNKIVTEMKRVVKRDGALVFADFQVPLPGNIWSMFARSLEFIAGGSHYRGFNDFISNNGLEKIVNDHLLYQEKTGVFKGGILKIIKARFS